MAEVNVLLRCGYTPFRFLLEGVQDVDRLRIADSVDGASCVASMIRDNFKYRPSTQTSERLGCWIGFTLLGGIQSVADVAPDLGWKAAQVSSA